MCVCVCLCVCVCVCVPYHITYLISTKNYMLEPLDAKSKKVEGFYKANTTYRNKQISDSESWHPEGYTWLRKEFKCSNNIHAQRNVQKHCLIYPRTTLRQKKTWTLSSETCVRLWLLIFINLLDALICHTSMCRHFIHCLSSLVTQHFDVRNELWWPTLAVLFHQRTWMG